MKRFLLALLLATYLLPQGFGHCREVLTRELSIKQAEELLAKKPQGMVILDVRTPEEFEQGHLPGAANMNFFGPSFERQAAKLPKDKPILVYCKSGRRSAGAADLLHDLGLTNILNLTDGFDAWKKAGKPVEK